MPLRKGELMIWCSVCNAMVPYMEIDGKFWCDSHNHPRECKGYYPVEVTYHQDEEACLRGQ